MRTRTVPISRIAFLLAVSVPGVLAAQSGKADPTLAVTVAYFGELVAHPGTVVGLEVLAFEDEWYRFGIGVEAGGYVHLRNQWAALFSGGVSNRFTGPLGLYGEVDIGVGYLHTWAAAEIYSFRPDGGVAIVADAGYPHFLARVDLKGGFDFAKRGGAPLGAFLGLTVFAEYPFNGFLLPHVALQTGVVFDL